MISLRALARDLGASHEDVIRAARSLRIRVSATAPGEHEFHPNEQRKIRELLAAARQPPPVQTDPAGPPIQPPPAISEDAPRRKNIVLRTDQTVRRLLVHGDVLDRMHALGTDSSIGRNVSRALLQLQTAGRTNRVKSVKGLAKGWLRTPLGGAGGNQFYLWWQPSRAQTDGPSLERQDIAVRAVRHHDETDQALAVGHLTDDYHELPVSDLIGGSADFPVAFTSDQVRIATSERRARVIQGYPGTGKTIALQRVILDSGVARSLYVTKSELLASNAKQFFDNTKYVGAEMFAVSWIQLLARLTGVQQGEISGSWDRSKISAWLAQLNDKELGPWKYARATLLDEIHAFVVGRCWLPIIDDPLNWPFPLNGATYLTLRKSKRFGGLGPAAQQASTIIQSNHDAIRTAVKGSREDVSYQVARELLGITTSEAANEYLRRLPFRPDAIVIDEVQDLLPVEYAVLIELARVAHIADANRGTQLVLAGDEGQTVGDSAFDFGELSDLIQTRFTSPSQEMLDENLRSPSQITGLIAATADLYEGINKTLRPKGRESVAENDPVRGEVLLCEGWRDPAATREILDYLIEGGSRGTVIIAADDEQSRQALNRHPALASPQILSEMVSPAVAKGLDWPTAVVVAPSRVIRTLKESARASAGRLDDAQALVNRRLIDSLRVAVSRAAEKLILLELDDTASCEQMLKELGEGETWKALRAEPQEILDHLKRDSDLSPEDHVRELLDEAQKWLSSKDLDRARRRARRAVHCLGRPDIPGGVYDLDLRQRAHFMSGLIDLTHYVRLAREDQEMESALPTQAAESIQAAGYQDLGAAITALYSAAHADAAPMRWASLASLCVGLSSSQTEIVQILREQAVALYRQALDPVADRLWPSRAPKGEEIDLVILVATRLSAAGEQDAIPAAHAAFLRWANTHFSARRFRDAVSWYEAHPSNPALLRARCYEGLLEWDRAAPLYESLLDLKNALRCWRERASLPDARRVAKALDDKETLAVIDWLDRVRGEQLPALADLSRTAKLSHNERQLLAPYLAELRAIDSRR